MTKDSPPIHYFTEFDPEFIKEIQSQYPMEDIVLYLEKFTAPVVEFAIDRSIQIVKHPNPVEEAKHQIRNHSPERSIYHHPKFRTVSPFFRAPEVRFSGIHFPNSTARRARVILADCPWQHNDRRETRKDNPGKKAKFGIGAVNRYSASMLDMIDDPAAESPESPELADYAPSAGLLNLQALKDLGPLIQAVAAPDAYLFMWATCPMTEESFQVMRSWGFPQVTLAMAWKKITVNGLQFCGPGRHTFSNLELLQMGRDKRERCWHAGKGWKPKQFLDEYDQYDVENMCLDLPHPRWFIVEDFPDLAVKVGDDVHVNSYLVSSRWDCFCKVLPPVSRAEWAANYEHNPKAITKKFNGAFIHSRKPVAFRQAITDWLSPSIGPDHCMMELFATERAEGWVSIGHAISGNDIRQDLVEYAELLPAETRKRRKSND